jgi:hypothetical protein
MSWISVLLFLETKTCPFLSNAIHAECRQKDQHPFLSFWIFHLKERVHLADKGVKYKIKCICILRKLCGRVTGVNTAQDRFQGPGFLSTAKHFYVPHGWWLSWPDERLLASREVPCTKKFVSALNDPLNCNPLEASLKRHVKVLHM